MAKKRVEAPAIVSAPGVFEERHKVLLSRVENLFSQKAPFMSLCQDIAENFYPARANFTYSRNVGEEYATGLATSYPLLVARDLGDSMSSMLRPQGNQWFHMAVGDPDDRMDNAAKAWLEEKTKVQMRAMSDPVAMLSKATHLTDHDWTNFGNGVLSLEVNRLKSALLFRNWHLRDMVWCEKYDGSVGLRGRNWKPTARELAHLFKDRVHSNVTRKLTENNGAGAYSKVNVRHVVVPADEYDGPNPRNWPWISLFIDVDSRHVMEEVGLRTGYYIVPRWFCPDDSQYARSPAVIAGLPDARLMQQMTFTLLKAGEKAVDPPMIAIEEAVKSPIDIYPGGVTWASQDYDERLGEVLRPLTVDSRGFPLGINLLERTQSMLASCFYIDKIHLPGAGREMTAYEVSQRIREYIQQVMPLFQPVEQEYSAPLCEDAATLLMAEGAFGPASDIPESLQGQNIRFRFESPITEAEDQAKVQQFQTALALSEQAAAYDPAAAKTVNIQVALRDALKGGQVPAKWLRDEREMEAITAQEQQKAQAQQAMDMVGQGAAIATEMGNAGQSLKQAAA
jgi:hypothetical protein